MIQYHIYPGGTRRIVTFSYDDGKLVSKIKKFTKN